MLRWLLIGALADCGRLIGLPIHATGDGADPDGSILKQRVRALMELLTAQANVEHREIEGFCSGLWKLVKLKLSTPAMWWRHRQLRRRIELMLGEKGLPMRSWRSG